MEVDITERSPVDPFLDRSYERRQVVVVLVKCGLVWMLTAGVILLAPRRVVTISNAALAGLALGACCTGLVIGLFAPQVASVVRGRRARAAAPAKHRTGARPSI